MDKDRPVIDLEHVGLFYYIFSRWDLLVFVTIQDELVPEAPLTFQMSQLFKNLLNQVGR